MTTTQARFLAAARILKIAEGIATNKAVRQRAPMAYQGLLYLAKNGQLCEPSPRESGGVYCLDYLSWRHYFTLGFWRRQQPLRFLPLVAADQELNHFWQDWYQQTRYCNYGSGNHLISLRLDMDETEPFAACCVLHELFHVLRAEQEGRARRAVERTFEERVNEEVEIYDFERELYRGLGGAAYETVLQEAVAALRQAPFFPVLFFTTQVHIEKSTVMDVFLGPAPSPSAQFQRANMLALHAFSLYCDQALPADQARQRKVDALKEQFRTRYQEQADWHARIQQRSDGSSSP